LSVEQILELLSEGPPRLAAAIESIDDDALRRAPSQGEWSANEVLAHMRSCADMWGGSIAAIVVEQRTTVREIHPRQWIKSTNYLDLEFRESREAFARQRDELLTVLRPLEPEQWARSARATGAARGVQRDVHFYAQKLAQHEHAHVQQIERLIKQRLLA